MNSIGAEMLFEDSDVFFPSNSKEPPTPPPGWRSDAAGGEAGEWKGGAAGSDVGDEDPRFKKAAESLARL